jgi:hypothetical protein
MLMVQLVSEMGYTEEKRRGGEERRENELRRGGGQGERKSE